jgi:uncharacterized protein
MMKKQYIFLLIVLMLLILPAGFTIFWLNKLIAPVNHKIPASICANFENVEFRSASGAVLKGWYGHHKHAMASVMLLHGVRDSRTGMESRARLLYENNMNVLLFDFRAHGESTGNNITFGYLESLDAEAAFAFLKKRTSDIRIGAVGFSLGGAAILLSDDLRCKLDFLIIEATHATIETAISNRITMRHGKIWTIFTPFLSELLRLRLGISPEQRQLQPVTEIHKLNCPVFVIGGSDDKRTILQDSHALFNAAPEPKYLWIVNRARHENFHKFARKAYEKRVLEFINFTCLTKS